MRLKTANNNALTMTVLEMSPMFLRLEELFVLVSIKEHGTPRMLYVSMKV